MPDSPSTVRDVVVQAVESLYLGHQLATALAKGRVPISSYVNSRVDECTYNVVILSKAGMSWAELKTAYTVDAGLQANQDFVHPVVAQARAQEQGRLVSLHAENLPLPAGFASGTPRLEKKNARYFLIARGRRNELAALGAFGFNLTSGAPQDGHDGAVAREAQSLDDLLHVNLHVSFDYVYTFKAHRGQGAAKALILVAYEAYVQELSQLAAQLRPAFESTGLPFKLTTTVYSDVTSHSGKVLSASLLTLIEGAHALVREGDPLFRSIALQELEDESAFVSLY